MSDQEQTAKPEPAKGQRWKFDASNPFLIAGSSFYPAWSYLTVEWNDGENVHYRLDSHPTRIQQTSIERFWEIAEFVEDQLTKPKSAILAFGKTLKIATADDQGGVTLSEVIAEASSEEIADKLIMMLNHWDHCPIIQDTLQKALAEPYTYVIGEENQDDGADEKKS